MSPNFVFAAIVAASVLLIVLMLIGFRLMDKAAAKRQAQLKEGRD